jgi:hypothetical protein
MGNTLSCSDHTHTAAAATAALTAAETVAADTGNNDSSCSTSNNAGVELEAPPGYPLAERVQCVVCLDHFAPSHGVSCSGSRPHFVCGNAGGSGCLGGHVHARVEALLLTDLLARPG